MPSIKSPFAAARPDATAVVGAGTVADVGPKAAVDASEVAETADVGAVDAAPDAEVDRPKVRYVTILVSSDPPGATVLLGKRPLGRTPFKLTRQASRGSLGLTLKRGGYYDAKVRVPLSRDGSARAKLEPMFELVP